MLCIASDHGALELKETLLQYLTSRNVEFDDIGTQNSDSVDYPDFAEKVADTILSGKAESGILLCGTGIGMSIAANKIDGIRAALVTDPFMAQMAKEHNNANILVLGGRVLSAESIPAIVGAWLDAPFEAGRHQNRLDKIAALEKR